MEVGIGGDAQVPSGYAVKGRERSEPPSAAVCLRRAGCKHRFNSVTLSLVHSAIWPGLLSLSSHLTPPSHCSRPLTMDVLSILCSPLQLLLDSYALSSMSPIPNAVFKVLVLDQIIYFSVFTLIESSCTSTG